MFSVLFTKTEKPVSGMNFKPLWAARKGCEGLPCSSRTQLFSVPYAPAARLPPMAVCTCAASPLPRLPPLPVAPRTHSLPLQSYLSLNLLRDFSSSKSPLCPSRLGLGPRLCASPVPRNYSLVEGLWILLFH